MEEQDRNIFCEISNMIRWPWPIAFLLYFLVVIVIINGFSVFICPFKFNENELMENFSQNLSIYSIAIFTPAFFSLLLKLPQDLIHNKVSFVILCIAVVAIEIFAIPIAYKGNIYLALFCTLISWFFWVAANRDNEYLNDETFEKIIKKDVNKHGEDWN